jgi:site-specific DNA-methyltransferase (adenine-specific)
VNIARDIHAFSDGDDITLTVREVNKSQEKDAEPSRLFYQAKASKKDRMGSKHPTVKPVKLMQYLVRLITPPGGTVLDCFAGTGTTGQAAITEGCRAILIEREEEYLADIDRRFAPSELRL